MPSAPAIHSAQVAGSGTGVALNCALLNAVSPSTAAGRLGVAGAGVAQGALGGGGHHHARAAAHTGGHRGGQHRVTWIVAGDDEHVQRADPRRHLGCDGDGLGGRTTQCRSQYRAGRLGRAAARHPDHRPRPVAGAQFVQGALVDGGSGGAYLRAGHRHRAQQAVVVGVDQRLGVVEVARDAGGAHGATSSSTCLTCATSWAT